MLTDPVRSAEPPIRVGIFGVRTESIFSDDFLVEIDSKFLITSCFLFWIISDILILVVSQ